MELFSDVRKQRIAKVNIHILCIPQRALIRDILRHDGPGKRTAHAGLNETAGRAHKKPYRAAVISDKKRKFACGQTYREPWQ